MAQRLTLLSGKGGSGKTTIALSLAKMLSDCGLRTLLIDCDIATNGATYFFETKLERKEQYLSLSSLFRDVWGSPKEKMLHVDENFWFVPSNTSFPNDSHTIPYHDDEVFIANIGSVEDDFDAIIFDCQAGHSKVTASILASSTTNLVVLEPDAISSSSIRVLYAQMSDLIEKVKTYQIFNKITEEEFSVYRQMVGGTTFTPLPPVKFNWEVRRAFAFAKIPEMVSTNVEFGKNVFELATMLFPCFQKSLSSYTRNILTIEKEELELELKKLETLKYEELQSVKMFRGRDSKSSIYDLMSTMMPILLVLMTSLFTFFITIEDFGFFLFERLEIFIMVIMVAMIMGAFASLYMRMLRRKKDAEESHQEKRKQAEAKFDFEHAKLIKRISEIDKTVSQD